MLSTSVFDVLATNSLFNKVSFMDSAGIGLVLGRYKNASILGSKVELINVNKSVYKILKMSGIVKLIPIKEEVLA